MADELVGVVAREIARATLHDMQGSDPGPLSDERWAEMACDEDRVYLENIARAIIPLVQQAERADVVKMGWQIIAERFPTNADHRDPAIALLSEFLAAVEANDHRSQP